MTGATCLTMEDDDHAYDSEIKSILAGVCEMKNSKTANKQLFANMIRVAAQVTVKALKEGDIVD